MTPGRRSLHLPVLLAAHRREVVGSAVALVGVAIVTAALVTVRTELSTATPALVLVLPVVSGVVVGGFTAGLVAVAAGFLAFDLFFIPPYFTLAITAGEDWIALGVYFAVVLLVARLVATVRDSEVEARRHAEVTARILELSRALISDRPFDEFLDTVTAAVHEAFEVRSVALLLPRGEGLEVVSSAGEAIPASELPGTAPMEGAGPGTSTVHFRRSGTLVVPLTTATGPVGMMVLRGAALRGSDEAALQTYANQAALALERSQLRDQAIRSRLLEEIDRWRDALIGAVSHDLRTPLAVIKAAVSDLLDDSLPLDADARLELLHFIEDQSDRLARLVVNILDMTRIRAGALVPRKLPVPVDALVAEALGALPRSMSGRVRVVVPVPAPVVDADHVLIAQVLANLVENADRHAPEGTGIEIAATSDLGEVTVTVTDHGPGVAAEERSRIFDLFSRVNGAGRAGLGLAICKAFVEAHEGTISVRDAVGGGACFRFTLPASRVPRPVMAAQSDESG